MSGDTLTHGGNMRMKQPRLEGLFGRVGHGRTVGHDRVDLDRPLPEWECKPHGRLPGDSSEPCGCFPSEQVRGEGWPACGRCGDLSYPGAARCEGCGGKL